MAVPNGDQCLQGARAEARFKTLNGLGCQGYFGHEPDRAFALLERMGNGLEINFSFAAAGNAVQEKSSGWSLFAIGLLFHSGISTSVAGAKDKGSRVVTLRCNKSVDRGLYRRESLCLGVIKEQRLGG